MFILLIIIACSLFIENVVPQEENTFDITTQHTIDNKFSNEMLLSIIDDIVQSRSKKIYHTIYNINQNTSICFKDYIYMKEDNDNGKNINTWREFEFTFDYPGYCCNDSSNTNETFDNQDRYKIVSVVFENGARAQLPFETVEESTDYTTRRNVRVYCMSRLSVLNKTYFEAANSNQKKVVIKMSDIDEHYGEAVSVLQDDNSNEEFVSNRRNQDRDIPDDEVYEIKRAPKVTKVGKSRINTVLSEIPLGEWMQSTSFNESPTTDTSSVLYTEENNVNETTLSLKNVDGGTNRATLSTSLKKTDTDITRMEPINDLSDDTLSNSDHKMSINSDNKHIVSSSNDQPSSLIHENVETIKAAHSDASILTKFLSGKWVLSSLIDLGDDKIVVRGDITVRRKHQNCSSGEIEEPCDSE